MNGASDLLGEIFGESRLHARTAFGVSELPLNAPVEVELIVELTGEQAQCPIGDAQYNLSNLRIIRRKPWPSLRHRTPR
jgi:hypothetical protein